MGKINKLTDLIPDNKNFNTGSEFGNSLIEKSFRKFDSKTIAAYINYSRHFVYKLIIKKGLPFHKDNNGEIYFLKDEVDQWLVENKKERHESVVVECDTCKKGFLLHNYRAGKTKKNYCSRKCRKTSKIINCDWCKKEIIRVPAQIEKHNFCSTSCMGKYQTKNYSGKNSKHWLGDYQKYYGSDWNHQRNAARERDNFECQICGIKETVKQHDVHHKKAFATFGIERHKEANELNNLITLCNSCHSKIEPKRTKGLKNKNGYNKRNN
jgi:excisionase family DNA binding protein